MIAVSVSGVRTLARRLENGADRLGRHGQASLAPGLTDGVGDQVAYALQSVERDWSKQRKVIVGYLDATGKAARAAADAYQQIEDELSRVAGGGRPSTRSAR